MAGPGGILVTGLDQRSVKLLTLEKSTTGKVIAKGEGPDAVPDITWQVWQQRYGWAIGSCHMKLSAI